MPHSSRFALSSLTASTREAEYVAHLTGCFSNPKTALTTLIRRVFKGSRSNRTKAAPALRHDMRGPLAKNSGHPQTRLTLSQRISLVADYESGMSIKRICEKYRVHRGTIPLTVRREGGTVRKPATDAATRHDASLLYEQGLTLAEVASQLNIAVGSVRNAIVEHGGTLRPKGKRRQSHKVSESQNRQ